MSFQMPSIIRDSIKPCIGPGYLHERVQSNLKWKLGGVGLENSA